MNYIFLQFGQLKEKLRELLEAQNEAYKNILKGSHLDALYQLGLGALDYLKWTQENSIKSYEANDAYRMDMWMDEMTTKVFTFIEHLINAMDVGEVQKKKQMRSYRKIPTQLITRSLKSMTTIGQNDLQIQSFNKILSEEESNGRNFGENGSITLINQNMPSLANHLSSSSSFQFQRSPISGKYSPNISQQQFKSLTPDNQKDKKKNQKSSVLDAFHTFLNLSESGSNNDTPNGNTTISDFQSTFSNPKFSLKNSILNFNNKSLFFSSHLQKSTFNCFDVGQSSCEDTTLEKIQQESDKSLEQEMNKNNQITIIEEQSQQEIETKKKGILLKRTSIEGEQFNVKKKVNLTSFDNIDNGNRKKSKSTTSQWSNSKNSLGQEGDNENDEDEKIQKSSKYSHIVGQNQVRYSLNDLQRIDLELKEKKARLKEESLKNNQLAEQQMMKSREENNKQISNFQNQIKRQKYQKFSNFHYSANFNSEGIVSQQQQRAASTTQLNKIDLTQEQLNSINSLNSNNEIRTKNNSIHSLRNSLIKPLNLDKLNMNNNLSNLQSQREEQPQQPNNNPTLVQSQQPMTYDQKFNSILNQKQFESNNIFSPQMSQNNYYLQNSALFKSKKQSHLKMDFNKNEIKIKSKIQIDEQQFNSTLDGIDAKQLNENKSLNNSKLVDSFQQQILNQVLNPLKSPASGRIKQSSVGNFKSTNHLILSQDLHPESSDHLFKNRVRNNSSQLTVEFSAVNSPQKIKSQNLDQFDFSKQLLQESSSSHVNSKFKLPSLHQNSSQQPQHMNQNTQPNKPSQMRGESEKKYSNTPKVSFVTPTFNQMATIKQAIDVNQIQYLQKMNRQHSENLKNILLANFGSK